MPSLTTVSLTDVRPDSDECNVCPDCGQPFDSTTDPGCETCEAEFSFDNYPYWSNDNRWNAWDDDDTWAEDHDYVDA